MAKSTSITEATRLLLQASANVYYRGLSEDAKASVRANFFASDNSHMGRISLHDFLESRSSPPGMPHDPARIRLFHFLDTDNTGFLELDEFILLHYMDESGIPYCSSCGTPIVVGAYSCIHCPPLGRASFELCFSCFGSPTAAFGHHHPRTSFVNLVPNFKQINGATHTPCNISSMPSSKMMQQMKRETVHLAAPDERDLIFNCDCCGMFIVTEYRYTCKDCRDSFDLCISCYSSLPPYFRHHHPYSSFMRKAQSQATRAAAGAATMKAQCTAMQQHHPASYIATPLQQQSNNEIHHSKIGAGIRLVSKLVDFSMQTGLLNNQN